MNQQSLRNSITCCGRGLHSGKDIRMTFLPAEVNTGIVFRRVDLPGKVEIPATVDYFQKQDIMCSGIQNEDGVKVILIEHILGALSGFCIDNLIIEINGEEPPFMDGSAGFISDMILKAGILKQDAPRRYMRISTPITLKEGEIEISAVPSEHFRISFFAKYDHPMVGTQYCTLDISPENFHKELSSARTFCFEHDVEKMLAAGLLKGANEKTGLVYGKNGLLYGATEMPLEPVRHKMLDLLGDLYLLGMPILAHVMAVRSGHATHARFVDILRKEAC